MGLFTDASLVWADPVVHSVCHPALSEHFVSPANAYLNYYQLAINNPILADELSDQFDTSDKVSVVPAESALYLLGQYKIAQFKKESDYKQSQILQQLTDLALHSKQRWISDEVAFLVALNHYYKKNYTLAYAQLEASKSVRLLRIINIY
ncbi:hypothetical protein JCM19237_2801 [Photobacterium aphoticum]|uniref:Uncharacterized protein n=1 Tax=Photobacterium aphoticum TaxID=754436 RepID=A0A090QXU5_9GAMM|nr:hypothetical protein JCM19237_2801 [Photobacterium aphoticum]